MIRYKSTSSNRWINRHVTDKFIKQSKTDHFKSRAAYKLIEVLSKYKVLTKKTRNIVDLGYSPGSWSQVLLKESKSRNIDTRILGVDLIKASPPVGVSFIQGDILNPDTHQRIRGFFQNGLEDQQRPADNAIDPEPKVLDLVLSDMMINTTGIKSVDHFSSVDLCESALHLSNQLMKKNGNLVVKFFMGKEQQQFELKLKDHFKKVYKFKPLSSRDELREMYFIALNKR